MRLSLPQTSVHRFFEAALQLGDDEFHRPAAPSTAGTSVKIPVKVQGSAAGSNLKSLKVYLSFDGGTNWSQRTVNSGQVTVKNPAAGRYVSLKAVATAKNGSSVSEQLINVYVTK